MRYKNKVAAGLLSLGLAVGIAPTALAAPVPGPGYELYGNPDGSIARWNPCQTIHYRVNAAAGGPGALDDVFSAVSQLGSASGLRFVYDGPSGQIPQSNYATTIDPNRPAPLLIAWATPGQSNALPGNGELAYSGTGMYSWTDPAGVFHPTQIASGYSVFTSTANLQGGFGPASYATRGRLLLHELGHAVGLMHVDDSNQVMYPVVDGRAGTYAAGDRAGLARVGSAAGCVGASVPVPTAQAGASAPAPVPAPAQPWWEWLIAGIQSWFRL